MTTVQNPSGEDWNLRLAKLDELRDAILGSAPARVDAAELCDIDARRAAIVCALPELHAHASGVLAETAAIGAAAALCRARSDGVAVLEWPDGRRRGFPAGGGHPTPVAWLRALGCALAARDATAAAVLTAPEHVDAVQLPAHLQDPFWPPLCDALATMVRGGRPEAAAGRARALLAQPIERADPGVVLTQLAPLLDVVDAVGAYGQMATERQDAPVRGVSDALERAARAHEAYFASHGQPGDPFRLLSLPVLGLAAWAHDAGHEVAITELLAAIVRRSIPLAAVRLTFDFGRRAAGSADETLGFLDLAGVPRGAATHTLVERDGALVAAYEVAPTGGLPRATAEFVLDAAPSATLPPALDAGERVLLAGEYARWAGTAIQGGDERLATTWLTQAVRTLDAVLGSFPSGGADLAASAFVTERGRAVFDAEPGRFRRSRLQAYRDALAQQMPGAPAATPEDGHRTSALAAAILIRDAVTPLVRALADDVSGVLREGLRPRTDDVERVFVGEAVPRAREAFNALWRVKPRIERQFAQTAMMVHVCPAGLLLERNELSAPFPEGYRSIAKWLQPQCVWVAWKYVKPGQTSGTAYDGLVWCGDHWAWMPRPYRALATLMR